MKKIFYLILLFLLVPFNIKAVAISDTDISGPSSVKVGDKLSTTFTIYISGIQKGNKSSLGLALVDFSLDYDTNVLSISNISSNDNVWDTEIENGKVISSIKENKSSSNLCSDGFSYCSNYSVNIQFSVKDTSNTSTIIKMSDVEIGVIPMLDTLGDFNEDDVIEVKSKANSSKTINITRNNNTNNETNIIQSNTNENTTKKDNKLNNNSENSKAIQDEDKKSDTKSSKKIVYKNKEKEKKKEFKIDKKYIIIPSIFIILIISIILFVNYRNNKKIDEALDE